MLNLIYLFIVYFPEGKAWVTCVTVHGSDSSGLHHGSTPSILIWGKTPLWFSFSFPFHLDFQMWVSVSPHQWLNHSTFSQWTQHSCISNDVTRALLTPLTLNVISVILCLSLKACSSHLGEAGLQGPAAGRAGTSPVTTVREAPKHHSWVPCIVSGVWGRGKPFSACF